MQVDTLMINDGPSSYYTDDVRNVLEDHMGYLRNHPATQLRMVDAGLAKQYQNDFYGLMAASNVPMNLQWVVLRMNQFTSPMVTLPDSPMLLVPNPDIVNMIVQSFVTANRIM